MCRRLQILVATVSCAFLVVAATCLLAGCSSSQTALTTSTSARPSSTSLPQALPKIGQILFDGDSLTAGSGATDPYPSQVMRGLPGTIKWRNLGKGGRRVEDMLKTADARVDPLFDPRVGRNVVVIWGGSNDLALMDHEPSVVYQNIRSYCMGREHRGFAVLVLTLLPRSDRFGKGFEVRREAVNRMLRAHWPEFANGLVDVAADPHIGPAGAERDHHYYVPGHVHLNNQGLAVVAGHVVAGLLQLESQ